MSTKIYDAYKFPKKLSLDELNQRILQQSFFVTRHAQKLYLEKFLKEFVRFYDQHKVHSRKWATETIVHLNEKLASGKLEDRYARSIKELINIRNALIAENYNSAIVNLDWYIQQHIEMFKANRRYADFDYNFESKIVIIPTKAKILAMTFGNPYLNGTLVTRLGLEDYHYQNQTDRPENISKKSWDIRKKVWDNAIGPDYIPINHGFEYTLVDDLSISLIGIRLTDDKYSDKLFTKQTIKELLPDFDSRVSTATGSFDDYPNAPDKNADYSAWLRYTRSEDYIKWKKRKANSIRKKLISNEELLDVICKIFNLED